ncbi:MAG: Ig-like domain-containing protein, partial [Pseudomonadota bacterium]
LAADLNGDGSQQTFTVGKTTAISNAGGPVGTILIRANGAYNFIPAPNFFGDVPTITYTVSDSRGLLSSTTLDITVDGVPDVANDRLTTPENVPILVGALDNDFDPEGDGPATVELFALPPTGQGVLSYTDAGGTEFTFDPASPPFRLSIDEFRTLTFTPADGFTGQVSTFAYTVSDTDGTPGTPGDDEQASARVEIIVSDTPEAVDDDFVVAEDTTLPLTLQTNDDAGSGLQSVTLGVLGD